MIETVKDRSGEYESRGDYHREVDPHWSYAPIYMRKVELVDAFVGRFSKDDPILDVGAGEGALVERYLARGYHITGVDPHYSSSTVSRAGVLSLPFDAGSFKAVLCLDVLEHLNLLDQPRALSEMRRVLAEDGTLLLSLPNLAHLHSRINFMLRGRLTRTSAIERHPGDRPIGEYIDLITRAGFRIASRRGIFPTVPLVFRWVNRHPAELGWMVSVLTRVLPVPSICLLNLVEAQRQRESQM